MKSNPVTLLAGAALVLGLFWASWCSGVRLGRSQAHYDAAKVYTEAAIQQAKAAQKQAKELRATADRAGRAATYFRTQLDSLLSEAPIALAPAECKPYTDMVSTCQKQAAQLDTALTAERERGDSLETALVVIKDAADSLVNVKPPRNSCKFLLLPCEVWSFTAGYLAGSVIK